MKHIGGLLAGASCAVALTFANAGRPVGACFFGLLTMLGLWLVFHE